MTTELKNLTSISRLLKTTEETRMKTFSAPPVKLSKAMRACLANFEKLYPTKEAAIAAFGPQNFSAIAHTPLHLPAQKTPTLLEVERLYGKVTLAVIVRSLIYHLQNVLRQPNKLGVQETDDLAARMCEAYNGIEAGELVSF